MQKLQYYIEKAYQFPYCIFIMLGVTGLILLIIYITACESENERTVGGSLATLCFFPSLFAFMITVVLSVMVGIRCIKKAYSETNEAMQKQIEEEYGREINGLKNLEITIDDRTFAELWDYP